MLPGLQGRFWAELDGAQLPQLRCPVPLGFAQPKLSFDERLANLAKSFPQFPDELLREKLTKYDGHVGHARIALVQALARPELDQEASLALSSAERARSMVRTPQSERVAAAWRCIWVG